MMVLYMIGDNFRLNNHRLAFDHGGKTYEFKSTITIDPDPALEYLVIAKFKKGQFVIEELRPTGVFGYVLTFDDEDIRIYNHSCPIIFTTWTSVYDGDLDQWYLDGSSGSLKVENPDELQYFTYYMVTFDGPDLLIEDASDLKPRPML